MHPELFRIPFTHLTVKSYGLMMVIGFLAAVWVMRRLSRGLSKDPDIVTNGALYALVAGVIGARVFYVVHYFDQFQGDILGIFAVWRGGLELLGGVILAMAVILGYLRYHKLPVRRYLDVLAIGLFVALGFGRIGCFLNGCCYGKPTNVAWGVHFPYGSHPYLSQISPNAARGRNEAQLKLDDDFFGYYDANGRWYSGLKPYDKLTVEQKEMVDEGPFRCLAVHPTQLYSAGMGFFWAGVLYLFWRRNERWRGKRFSRPGCVFSLLFIVYGITRFFIEFLRDDNPFEFDGLTVSQNLSIAMLIIGVILTVLFAKLGDDGFVAQPIDKDKNT